jgi:amino acid adenylation domain-containing protein
MEEQKINAGAERLQHITYWNKQSALLEEDYHYVFKQPWRAYPEVRVSPGREMILSAGNQQLVREMGGGSTSGSFVILLTGICLLLYKYGRQDLIEINTPLFNLEGMPDNPVGKEVPLVMGMNDSMTVRELMYAVQQMVTDSYNCQDADIYTHLQKFRTNVFVYAPDIHCQHEYAGTGLLIRLLLSGPLKIQFSAMEGFSPEFAGILEAAFELILSGFNKPDTTIGDIGYKEELITADIPPVMEENTLHGLFQAQVESTPENIAIRTDRTQLTYAQLNTQANKAAWYLKEKCGIGKGDVVGVMMDRSEWMVIAMLGIMKVGAVYLPINTDTPEERIRFILKDANVKTWLIKLETFSRLGDVGGLPVIPLNSLLPSGALDHYQQVLCEVAGTDVAYVIYTSGSTGTPKGVVVSHQALAYSMTAHIKVFGITGQEKIPLFFPVSFDASLKQVFLCLFTGSTLIIPDKEVLDDPGSFLQFLQRQQATIANISPAYLRVLDKRELCSMVRMVITGGESPDVKDASLLASSISYFNSYGPTEASVCCINYKVSSATAYGKSIPLGMPVAGTRIWILDKQRRPLPEGVAGEIAIGGNGLANGYLNQPVLTQEKFVPRPDGRDGSAYLTGDIGVRLPDGNIEYLGRSDNQVKIRGYRIELDEISKQLLSHSPVSQAVVIKRTDVMDEPCLVAYIVSAEITNADTILAYLKERIPGYMLPYFIIQVPAMPLTPNGKIDEKALPHPHTITGEHGKQTPPRNSLDIEVTGIWSEVLGKMNIDINDNFFDLGGTSLQVIKVFERLNTLFPAVFKISEIFDNPTVLAQSDLISERVNDGAKKEEGYNITSFN